MLTKTTPMTHTFLYCLIFLLTLLILVTIHEWGHFWVARRLGVKTLQFSFGFGKPLWRRIGRDGTEYVFSWLPLGGYVQLLDGRTAPVPEAEKHRAFDTQSLWARMAILLAGPAMNMVLGFVAFTLVFIIGTQRITPVVGEVIPYSIAAAAQVSKNAEITMIDGQPVDSWQKVGILLVGRLGDSGSLILKTTGPKAATSSVFTLPLADWRVDHLTPNPLKSLGIVPYHPPMPAVIDRLEADSPAATAGIKPGDRILSINNRIIKDWLDLVNYTKTLPGETVPVAVERAGKRLLFQITLEKHLSGLHWEGKMGVSAAPPAWPADKRHLFQLAPLAALQQAVKEVAIITQFNGVIIKKLLTGKISLLSMGGPISVFETSTLAFQQGITIYLSFLGFLSVMLACINLLPIPGLDGGQLLFCLIEGFARRPIAWRWQQLFLRLGVICLILLMVQATVNDILRLFS